MKTNSKFAFSLVELVIVIAIFSFLITIIAQVTAVYQRAKNEWMFLSSDSLEAKEIGIRIEDELISSYYVNIVQTQERDEIHLDKTTFVLYKSKPKQLHETLRFIRGETKTRVRKISDMIYWKIDSVPLFNSYMVYEIAFYVYNRRSVNYQNKLSRKLVYYIVVHKFRR
ncbi:MAG: type II secretion system protein [bacterium]